MNSFNYNYILSFSSGLERIEVCSIFRKLLVILIINGLLLRESSLNRSDTVSQA